MQQLAIDYVGTEYGGFPVCMNMIHDGDVIYDFGVGEDISFLEGVLSQKNCHGHLFDFTPQSIEWFKENHADKTNMTYHEYGISVEDGELACHPPQSGISRRPAWMGFEHKETHPVKTLKTIMSELGHDHIDVLKVDIEGEEYKVIPQMLEDDIFPKQICLEYHNRWLGSKGHLHDDLINLLVIDYTLVCLVHGTEALWVRK